MERFSIEVSEREAANGIYSAMRAMVECRGGQMVLDDATREHILEAAKWLIDPGAKAGLMLCGLFGNGKTSMARGMGKLIEYVTERVLGYGHRKQARFITAKEVCKLCATARRGKNGDDEYDELFREPILIIDDLGEEPRELMIYGMMETPMIDLLSERYDRRRMTIVTTNLTPSEMGDKYGQRIYDRMREMFTTITFRNPSFRA